MTTNPWQDRTRSRDERVDALLAEMTVAREGRPAPFVWVGFQVHDDPAAVERTTPGVCHRSRRPSVRSPG